MISTLMLPWFPTILASSVGARLVGRERASWLGLACALFWVILVQTATGHAVWEDAALAASALAGSAAIVGMAEWSGRFAVAEAVASGSGLSESAHRDGLQTLVLGAVSEFDNWLEDHRGVVDVWPFFDEFLRQTLHHHCRARHVRTYRILSEGDGMAPLHALKAEGFESPASARSGIVGHVVTSGRSYYADDAGHGELVSKLASQSAHPPVWCFAIRQGGRTIGVVLVREMEGTTPRAALRAMEALVGQFWTTLAEVCRGRSALSTDLTTGMLTRSAFLEEAERATEASYAHGEPVALVVIAMEGLRRLMDDGGWDACDGVAREVASTARYRIRPDDLIGRFDDSRFVLLLRRVDSELASLIARQLADQLSQLPLASALGADVAVRCGVSGSGSGRNPVASLLGEAVRMCHRARSESIQLASDVDRPAAVGGSGS